MKQNSLLDQLRRVLSILLNLAVVRMEPIAIRMSWEAVGEQALTFYTENSNLFSAAVCLPRRGAWHHASAVSLRS